MYRFNVEWKYTLILKLPGQCPCLTALGDVPSIPGLAHP
jgi:hypothetical protein